MIDRDLSVGRVEPSFGFVFRSDYVGAVACETFFLFFCFRPPQPDYKSGGDSTSVTPKDFVKKNFGKALDPGSVKPTITYVRAAAAAVGFAAVSYGMVVSCMMWLYCFGLLLCCSVMGCCFAVLCLGFLRCTAVLWCAMLCCAVLCCAVPLGKIALVTLCCTDVSTT